MVPRKAPARVTSPDLSTLSNVETSASNSPLGSVLTSSPLNRLLSMALRLPSLLPSVESRGRREARTTDRATAHDLLVLPQDRGALGLRTCRISVDGQHHAKRRLKQEGQCVQGRIRNGHRAL